MVTSRVRIASAVMVLVVLAVALVLAWRTGGAPVGNGQPMPTPEQSPEQSPEDGDRPVDPSLERLEELRASDQFVELAEHPRAKEAPHARLAYENFSYWDGDERVEWVNKDELWDALAPAIRDEVLLLGPEYRQPLWDNNTAVPNSISVAWSDADTDGRGTYLHFKSTYLGMDGDPRIRYWPILVATLSGAGHIVARMESFELRESDYQNLLTAHEDVEDRTWAWVIEQAVVDL